MSLTRREFAGLVAGAAAGFGLKGLAAGSSGSPRWYKGMLHAHTCWSDGYVLPEQAVAAYKNGGYDFFSITDHNRLGTDSDRWMEVAEVTGGWPPTTIEPSVFEAYLTAFPDARWRTEGDKTYVRMSTMAEVAERFNEEGRFLFMPGCEVTTRIGIPDNAACDVHMNYIGLDALIPRAAKSGLMEKLTGTTAAAVIRETRDQVGRLAAKKGNPPHIFFVNHPHWRYYDVLPADIIANPDIRFFEVCNTGSAWAPEDSMPKDGFDNDRFWDAVNATRCKRGERLLYGIGTDDTHMYPDSGTSRCPITYGDAWIGVRSAALTPAALFAAMKNGDFYASGGVDFEDVRFDRSTGTLSVSVPAKAGVAYTVKFITTKSGVSVDPVRTVELPQQDDRPARSVPVYSEAVGAVVRTVSFGSGEAASASYTLAADDLYVRARVESNEPATYPNAINKMHPPTKVAWTQPYRHGHNRYVHDVSI
ncbi:MAG: hypothetical protein IJH50_03450 [Kiritimatiellae bacterium]|nr:hypothetical protein [Kiritimatiellia bacterium]